MRLTRMSFWGSLATLLYIPTIIIPKVNQTGAASVAKDEAQRWLDDANKVFDAANKPYQDVLLNLTSVQQQITDGNCFIRNYSAFSNGTFGYCQPTLTSNSLHDLTAAYGIDIVVKPSTVTTVKSFRTDNYREQKNCDDRSELNCYPVTTVRTSIYGTSITGAGSNLLIDCGLYKNGIILKSLEYIKSSTGQAIDRNNEVITDT